MSINYQSPGDALRAGLIDAAVGTAAGFAAQKIGGLRQEGRIGYASHKLLHAALGAVGGAILAEPKRIRSEFEPLNCLEIRSLAELLSFLMRVLERTLKLLNLSQSCSKLCNILNLNKKILIFNILQVAPFDSS